MSSSPTPAASRPAPLAGKVALVTGGSRGIGAAIVRRLAADGAAVAFTYAASADKAAALAAEVEAGGTRALAIAADSADAEALRAAVEQTAAHYGALDILVSNAGILILGHVDDYALADFDRMMAVNVRAPFVGAQAAAKHMKAGGRIVSIGSVVAERAGFPGASVYTTTKGAVAAMTRGLARDLGPRGITVNNVQPGPTITDMTPGSIADQLLPMLPVGRAGQDHEIAGLVAYLVGPQAGYVNGASLTIDGGYSS
ncbi:MAG: 3-oxoacyl-ACP reductase family protein [Solimonas sp.]